MKPKNSAKNSKAKVERQYRRLSAAVQEMKAIEKGNLAPSRVFVIESDGKGGFIRKQVAPVSKPQAVLKVAKAA